MRTSFLIIKGSLTNNLILKLIALICSVIIWIVLGSNQLTTITISAPVCLYNEPENYIIECPDAIMLMLAGTHNNLRQIKQSEIALHIDCANLSNTTNAILINEQNLFLPAQIKVLDWQPSPLLVKLYSKQEIIA
jgi:hypothetical protein